MTRQRNIKSMSKEVVSLIAEAVANPAKGQYVCKFCSQAFMKESTMLSHMCEKRRRSEQQGEAGVRLGFHAWLRFCQLSQGSSKLKTYDDFVRSKFYNDFVRFGRYCVGINVINFDKFADFVIKGNFNITHWTRDRVYNEYLMQLLKSEAAEDAVTRSIKHMESWAEEQSTEFYRYFSEVNTNRFVMDVQNGRISPWCIYCSTTGPELLERLTPDQLEMVWKVIDIDFWSKKLHNYPADAEMMRYILQQAKI